MARGSMAVYKFLVVAVAIFAIVLLGMGVMVQDPDIPVPTDNTSVEYNQTMMVRETANVMFNVWTYVGIGALVLGIILAILAYTKVLR